MTMATEYTPDAPARADLDALPGATVIEFGTGWCGYCAAAQSMIAQAFDAHPGMRHLKIEDGSGRPLGRSFHVRLWPTLVFMHAGQEVARVVRPKDVSELRDAFASLERAASA